MRIGWGYFTISATVILKEGHLWDEVNSRYLILEWELDFDGAGSSLSYDKVVTELTDNSPSV
jgi:hypothetical protein